jgi:hypothetical protein
MTRQPLLPAIALIAITTTFSSAALRFDAEQVVFYPTYGFQQGNDWIIPMRAKVQEPRDPALALRTLFRHLPERDSADTGRFRSRIEDFIADDQRHEDVRLQFDNDADGKEFRIADGGGRFVRTNSEGIVEGTLRLANASAQRLLSAQGSANGWLTYHVVSREHSGSGRVRLIGPVGVSVVSDIDDTIKVTEIPAGGRIVALNTFYRAFAATTELNDRYKEFADAPFHYVSGGPWQMYRPVSSFLIGGRLFPEGSFHMRTVSGGITTPVTSLEQLTAFAMPGGTFAHKVEQISTLMRRFPGRKFVLIGDSGEKDPEVYRQVQSEFSAQVQEIIIRDLVNARVDDPARLTGMTVVAAPTVEHGVSQFPQ